MGAAMETLGSLRPEASDLSSEIGDRRGAAFLRIWQTDRPGRWAVIFSPGDRWFSLEVDGGYSLDLFEEDTPEEEARQLLTKYVDVALAYVRGSMVAERTGRFRAPLVTVPTDAGSTTLRLSLFAGFKAALTPFR
ncbi:hypothetical protein [Microbacterium sp. NPDC058389]|uniref:hypothetical protein n=1 Tax=Microbacterium sp. NPDC058389 TaxID=3346475 RepID=UPI003656FEE6